MPERVIPPKPTRLARTLSGGPRLARSSHFWPVLIVVAAVVLGNSAYLLHFFNPDPLNLMSGLGSVTNPGVLSGSVAVDPNNGITAQTLGHLVTLDWFHGHVPWWNPFEGLGSPLAGEMQAAAFFPPTLLLYFANGQIYAHALVEVVAGLSTYFLLQRIRVGRPAALAGGIAFRLNGTYSWFSHAPANPVAFLPLLLLGIEMAAHAARERRALGWCTIAIALALSMYAGFPETAYIDGVLAALWVVLRAVQLGRSWRPFAVKVALGVGVGLLLAAPIIVAFVDYLPNAFLGGHNGSFGAATLPDAALPQTLIPYIYGPINAFNPSDPTGTLTIIWGNTGGYLAGSLLILGLIGLAGRRQRVLRIGLALWVVLALGRTYGVPLLQHIVNALPGMNDVAFFRYANSSWALAVIVLAALGLDDILKRQVSRWWVLFCAAVALVAVLLAALGARATLHDIVGAADHNRWAFWSLIWALAVTAAIGVGALFLRGRLRSVLLLALVSVDVVAMFVIPQLSAPRAATLTTAPVTFLQKHLGTYRYYSLSGPLGPNYGSYFGLSSLDTNDLPLPKAWETYVTHHLDPNANQVAFDGSSRNVATGPSALAEFMSHLSAFEGAAVKYLLTPAGTTLPPTPAGVHLPLVYSDRSLDIFALPHPQPLFTANGCFVRTGSVDAATVYCRSPQTLIRRELTMAGWSASVNGNRQAVRSASGVFQQVRVPAGGSIVVFNFTPPHLDPAWLALVLGLLVIGGVPVYLRRRAHPDRSGGVNRAVGDD